MSDINGTCEYKPHAKPIQQAVNIPNSLYKSVQGKYFIGQTPNLSVSSDSNAWAALVNSEDSRRILFFNVFTVSNFASNIITAELWLNTIPPGSPEVSCEISPTNTALCPQPEHRVLLEYVTSTEGTPRCGINILDRIVPPNTTLVSEEDGKIIIPPGGNVVIFLKSAGAETTHAIVAFGWWEERAR